jgi:hypothetical protein
VLGQGRLLLQHGHVNIAAHAGDAVGQGDADDAAPHDPDASDRHAGSLQSELVAASAVATSDD